MNYITIEDVKSSLFEREFNHKANGDEDAELVVFKKTRKLRRIKRIRVIQKKNEYFTRK